jgi:hypothetical protein
MEPTPDQFANRKEEARLLYFAEKSIYCPYFRKSVILDQQGFEHLEFSAGKERERREQLQRFSLLPLALDTIRKAGTIQEYRKILLPVGKKGRDGFTPIREVEYWGLVALVGERKARIKIVLRRVGEGSISFWSVMLASKSTYSHLDD